MGSIGPSTKGQQVREGELQVTADCKGSHQSQGGGGKPGQVEDGKMKWMHSDGNQQEEDIDRFTEPGPWSIPGKQPA